MQIEPNDHLLKQLVTPEAFEFGELQIILKCLNEAASAFGLFYKMIEGGETSPEKDLIKRALFRDAIVQLMSCFSKNEKKRHEFLIPAECFPGENWEMYYQYLHDLRDSYAAHKFGVQRQIAVIGKFDRETLRLEEIAYKTMFFDGQAISFKNVTDRIIAESTANVNSRLTKIFAVVEQQAKSLSPEQVKSLPNPDLEAPQITGIKTSREKSLRQRTQPG